MTSDVLVCSSVYFKNGIMFSIFQVPEEVLWNGGRYVGRRNGKVHMTCCTREDLEEARNSGVFSMQIDELVHEVQLFAK